MEDKSEEKHARPSFQRVIPVPHPWSQPERRDAADCGHGLR